VQVVIDIGGVNRLALAGGIDVLKKLIPWQLLAPFHNGGEATVVETHRVILPASLNFSQFVVAQKHVK
jgi:hypothetical protein